jgi:hypothetical protein
VWADLDWKARHLVCVECITRTLPAWIADQT